MPTTPQRLFILRASIVLLGFAALVVLALLPAELLAHSPSLCLWKNLFGIECPSCGMTRAFSSLLHGRFQQALRYNKLVLLAFPLYCGVLLREAARVAGFGKVLFL